MKKLTKMVAVLSLGLAVLHAYPTVGQAASQLNWIEMETTEDTKIPEQAVQQEPSFTQRIQKILKDAKVNAPKTSPTPTLLKSAETTISAVSADSSNIAATIEEIKKRRQEEDIMLANLLAKQKEQEQQQKEQERKKIVEDLAALQKKQKEEEQNQFVAVLQELKQQQAQQQADQNKNLLDILQALKTQQDNQQQADQNKQLALLQSTIEALKPQAYVSTSTGQMISLDDPQYAKKSIHQYISENTQDATEVPSREADVSFFYSSGALFRIYCKEGFLTDIQLQPGEEIQYIGGGDTVRWIIDKAQSGSGNDKTWHIYLKPLKAGLETNIVVNTDKHSYQIQAQSTNWYNPIVRWSYPQEERSAFYRQQAKEKKLEDDSISMGTPDKLNFNYSIKGKSYSWTPTVAFDDGVKTYIKMPASLSTGDAPALFIKEGKKKVKLVNYRVKNNYYIVDRLFKEGELRVGSDTVRIRQN
jgi:P-type conjugative transfer protein TrbG